MDRICVEFLTSMGLSVFSEESGLTEANVKVGIDQVVVLDPIDGSTNASRRVPLFVLSCALVDAGKLTAGYVHELTNHSTYSATQGEGAYWGDILLTPNDDTRKLGKSIVGLNGYPQRHLGWGQFRALGSAALELAMVASGQLDAYIDCSKSGLAPWDYLGAMFILEQAGCLVGSLGGDISPEVEFYGPRRHIVAARDPALMDEILRACSIGH